MTLSRPLWKRLLALTALLVVVAAAVNPWRLAERSVERFLLTRLSAQLGLKVTGVGDGAFALLPTPRVAANDVRVTLPGAFEARIPRIRGEIRLLALLAGRLEFDSLTLHAPQVDLRLADGEPDPLRWLLAAAPAEARATPRIIVRDGGALFLRGESGIVSTVRDLAGEAAARETGAAWEITGSASWRGERLAFALASNSPARATAPMLRVRADIANLEFTALRRPSAATPAGALEGQFSFSTTSLARVAGWIGTGLSVGLPLGATEIAGRMALSPDKADVRSAAVTIGADTLEGAFSWQKRDGRWRMSGTFAGRSLDIARPGSGVTLEPFSGLDLQSTQSIESAVLLSHDLDLRLSVQRLRIGALTLGDVAAQVMGNGERLDLSIANAAFYRGVLRGRATLDRAETGLELRAQAAAERVDLAQLSGDIFDSRRVTGQGAAQIAFEAQGRSMADLVGSLQGRLSANARNGDFAGTNLTDAMRRIERQPLAVARDWRGGRTAFEQFSLGGVLAGGVLELTEGAANGAAYRLSMGGRVSLPDRIVSLTGSVLSANAASVVPFDIAGPLGDPMVSVNPRGLIERSGAVQPFLERRAP
jgi:AsmA protein